MIILSGCLNSSGTAESPAFKNHVQGYVKVIGGRIFYQTFGVGQPIVVLHGSPMDQNSFLPQMLELAKDHQVTFYDQRGLGKSLNTKINKNTITAKQFVADLEALRQKLKYEKFILIGHSWGGISAMNYAIKYPQYLNSLILLNTGSATSKGYKAAGERFTRMIAPVKVRMAEIENSSRFKQRDPELVEEYFRLVLKKYFAKETDLKKLTLKFTQGSAKTAFAVSGILENGYLKRFYDLTPKLHKLSIPTLIIHGDKDLFPLWTVREIKTSVPNAELVVLKNCGHFSYIEKPKETFGAIREFLWGLKILSKDPGYRKEKVVKSSKGINLWTESFGDRINPAVLLIAGAQAPSTYYPDFFCKRLVEMGYFVIRYDHRDIGYSTHLPIIKDHNKPIYNLFDLTKDALAILDSYKIKRAYVIGHSMGGNVVQYLAAFYPERVLKVISMSVGVGIGTKITGEQSAKYNAVMKELLKNKPTGDFEKDWRFGWKRSFKLLHGSRYKLDETMAKNYIKTLYERNKNDIKPAWNQIAAQQNKAYVLYKLPAGMLFIHGSEDILSPPEEIQQLPKKFKTVILDGVGHMFLNRSLWNEILGVIVKHLKVN